MNEASLVRVVVGLLLVVAAILVAGWLARRAGVGSRAQGTLLWQIASQTLGPRQSVIIVEVDKTWLVLGVTPGQITTLHTLPAGELPVADATSFALKLGQALTRR
ncbi:flagellar biosynthetic protein FliO [Bordetella holmesii]|uniref:Flagellar protein n=2 Tax=Bordetella holmesii TaxID=35814 RepID=A0A158M2I5_9BORD|nr:flagellar biosynthetic protein FliO [Bordetella holmesii]AHV92346.1 flagellar biosynthetic protein FliO [Bordetella holmesii ATCC 51541]AIT28147.1 flagellar biosynthetic protein FliO [Bordetella holmesii 44057]EWM40933.1 flagellar biosynthetic protein FliO [Bordetella holmesii 35009]EWM42774.1 flagellar biosynthetic protein FliO [Bordetella holmesii 41130]EWM44825.1 flagellar biosynthetic protein FliO [Bordetella holmesii 70147]